jgi:hypothetical protein
MFVTKIQALGVRSFSDFAVMQTEIQQLRARSMILDNRLLESHRMQERLATVLGKIRTSIEIGDYNLDFPFELDPY